MKNRKYSKTVKDWYNNFLSCYGGGGVNDSEIFYEAGFDDGAGWVCSAMREAGIPLGKIIEVYSKLDPKGESISYAMIMDDWSEDDVESVVSVQQAA